MIDKLIVIGQAYVHLQRAADALGLSINSISKVSKKVRSGEPLAGPSKPKRAKTITAVSENQAIEIRNVIYQMHADSKFNFQVT